MLSDEVLSSASWLLANSAPPPPPPRLVGRFVACDIAAEAGDDAMRRWKERFSTQNLPPPATRACGPSFCNLDESLYFYDRCWNPRHACAVQVGTNPNAGSTLVVAQKAAERAGLPLHAGQYLTVLGPAAAFGVGAITGFADVLRKQLGLPVVNLGRGGAGPSLYLHSKAERTTELMAQSRAVIILVMAGRSSANSAFPLGVKAMTRAAGVTRILANDPARGARLMNESLTTAADEYATLTSRIRTHASRLGVPPPEILLLWISECDLSEGCAHPGKYPQFYTAGTDRFVRATAARIGARLVDASYGHVARPTQLTLGQCLACRPHIGYTSGRRSCTMDEARAQMNAPSMRKAGPNGMLATVFGDRGYTNDSALQGCTRTCGAVVPSYYPHDAAHAHAAHVLMRELRALFKRTTAPIAVPNESDATRAAASRSGLLSHPLLPRIDVSKKLFFNHIHKCAGKTFTKFLQRVPGATWCESLVAPDHVNPVSEAALVDWWFDGLPNCTLLALEQPTLGKLVARMGDERTRRAEALTDYYEPQTLTFYRDPYERCRSEWRYEQALCHPPGGLHTEPVHTQQHCRDWFLPRYGAYNYTSIHQAFVRRYCTDRISSDYERNGVAFGALTRSGRLLFLGLADDYFASTCLFWYQAGRFPFRECSCQAATAALGDRTHDPAELIAKGLRRSYTSASTHGFDPLGIPNLRLSREGFQRRNPGDVALYREAKALFDARVRVVEKRVGQRFSRCVRVAEQ